MLTTQGKTVVLVVTMLLIGCAEPDSLQPPRILQDAPPPESCKPGESRFPLVAGTEYVGVIIPEDYWARVLQSGHFVGFGVGTLEGFFTPTESEVEAAELNLRQEILKAREHPADAQPGIARYPTAVGILQRVLGQIEEALPKYRRQYSGIVVRGHRQVLCKFFLPSQYLGHRWLCQYVWGADFEHELWQVQYDLDSGTYQGLRYGS